jgi:hypothetical protein
MSRAFGSAANASAGCSCSVAHSLDVSRGQWVTFVVLMSLQSENSGRGFHSNYAFQQMLKLEKMLKISDAPNSLPSSTTAVAFTNISL